MKKYLFNIIIMLFISIIGATVPVTMAYANTTGDTQVVLGGLIVPKQTYVYNDTDFNNMVKFEIELSNKINTISITNNTLESDIKDVIDKVVDNNDGYKVETVLYNKNTSNINNSGQIAFILDVIDSDKNLFKMNFNLVIPKSEIYVYETIPEIQNKYIKVSSPEIIDKAIDGILDTNKYLIVNKPLDNDKIINTGWQIINEFTYHIYNINNNYGVDRGLVNIDGFMYYFNQKTGVYNNHLAW